MKTYKKLKLIELKEFDLWDIKRYTSKKLKSTFNIEKLSNCIKEENRKYKLYLEEDKTFGILGVNNKDGIFDAYEQKGKEINQPYKKMEIGWLAYNPYRINVGSIGIRKKEHLYQYISPAYVVFSCLDNLLPEYLYLLFRTERFIKIINESTTGSVRQNLTSEILKTLEIPLPSISEQETIVKNYYNKITQATTYEQQAETLEKNIENYLFESLGIEQKTEEKTKKKGLQFVEFGNLEKWGIDFILSNENIKHLFTMYKISDLCKISSGGTPSRGRKEYFEGSIPWIKTGELNDTIIYDTEEKITEEAIKNSSAKLYKKDSLVIAMYGATIGKTAKLGIEATTNQACAVLFDINTNLIEIDFLWEYLQSQTKRLKKMAYGSAQPNLNAKIISNYNIPIPPKETQQTIITQIDTYKNEIKILRERATLLKQQAEQEFEQTIFS
jgi:type I restriction-modification system specificity determinant